MPLAPFPTGDDLGGIERQRAKLDRLGDLALELTEILMQKAREAAGEAELERIALAVSRSARAVRQTVALHARLFQTLQEVEAARRAADTDARREGEYAAIHERSARKRAALHAVARIAVEHEGLEGAGAEDLLADWRERLDDDTLIDVLDQPVSETIAQICAQLGLAPDWDDLAGEAWARKEIAGGDVGAPLAAIAARMIAAPPGRRPSPRGPAPPARARRAGPAAVPLAGPLTVPVAAALAASP